MGLTLVRQLAEMHGGSVSAASDGPDRGSEFTVRLPVAVLSEPAGSDHAKADGSQSAGKSGRKKKILVVDDNHDAADSLVAVLELDGHQARAAYEGSTGLEMARQYRPDLVILDIGLPNTDGYKVASQIREALPETVLFALSGWRMRDDERARNAGFQYYFTKPISAEDLRKVLEQVP